VLIQRVNRQGESRLKTGLEVIEQSQKAIKQALSILEAQRQDMVTAKAFEDLREAEAWCRAAVVQYRSEGPDGS